MNRKYPLGQRPTRTLDMHQKRNKIIHGKSQILAASLASKIHHSLHHPTHGTFSVIVVSIAPSVYEFS